MAKVNKHLGHKNLLRATNITPNSINLCSAVLAMDFPPGYIDDFERWPPLPPLKPQSLQVLTHLDAFVESINDVRISYVAKVENQVSCTEVLLSGIT